MDFNLDSVFTSIDTELDPIANGQESKYVPILLQPFSCASRSTETNRNRDRYPDRNIQFNSNNLSRNRRALESAMEISLSSSSMIQAEHLPPFGMVDFNERSSRVLNEGLPLNLFALHAAEDVDMSTQILPQSVTQLSATFVTPILSSIAPDHSTLTFSGSHNG